MAGNGSPLFMIDAAGLGKIAAQMAAQLREDLGLRQLKGNNAAQGKVFRQATLTASAVDGFVECFNQNIKFTSAILMFQDTAGRGRFRLDGPGAVPTAAGIGLPIPAGGGIFTFTGAVNLQNFRMIAETGNTLDFAYELFL